MVEGLFANIDISGKRCQQMMTMMMMMMMMMTMMMIAARHFAARPQFASVFGLWMEGEEGYSLCEVTVTVAVLFF